MVGSRPEIVYRGNVRGSAQSGDGCREEAVEVLSWRSSNEMLPSPRRKASEQVVACLSGISGDPLHCVALSWRATGNQLSTQQC